MLCCGGAEQAFRTHTLTQMHDSSPQSERPDMKSTECAVCVLCTVYTIHRTEYWYTFMQYCHSHILVRPRVYVCFMTHPYRMYHRGTYYNTFHARSRSRWLPRRLVRSFVRSLTPILCVGYRNYYYIGSLYMYFIYAPHAVCASQQLNHFNDFRMRNVSVSVYSETLSWRGIIPYTCWVGFFVFLLVSLTDIQLDLKRKKKKRKKEREQQHKIYCIQKIRRTKLLISSSVREKKTKQQQQKRTFFFLF